MTRILIDGEDFGNNGFTGIIIGLTKCIRKYIPNAEIVIFSSAPEKYEAIAKAAGLHLHRAPWIWPGNERGFKAIARLVMSFSLHALYCCALRVTSKLIRKIKQPYSDYDLIIHFVPDWPTEDDRSAWMVLPSFIWLLVICMVSNRPVCILPSSMGPFKAKLPKAIVKLALNKTCLIALRENISYEYVRTLGLNKPQVILSSDLAFLLDAARQERVDDILRREGITKNSKPIVAICPNERAGRVLGSDPSTGELRYIGLITQLADYIIEKTDATVCLIPHVRDYDDVNFCKQVHERSRHKASIKSFSHNYSADELKGIIGTCEIFIGHWMHSTIAAMSQGVPTLPIAFTDKFYRLPGQLMGQEQYIVDLRIKDYAELSADMMEKVDDLWANREAVRQELVTRTKAVQERAWSYGKLISELGESCSDKD